MPLGLSFSHAASGGFKELGVGLRRNVELPWFDLTRFDELEVFAPALGNRVIWEGYNVEFPRDLQPGSEGFQVGAVGWSDYLTHDPHYRALFIDRMIEHWAPPSAYRKAIMSAFNIPWNGDASADTDPALGNSGLRLVIRDTWAAPNRPECEAVFDAGPGVLVGNLYLAWDASLTNNNFFELFWMSADDDAVTAGGTTSADVYTAGNTGMLDVAVAGKRFVLVAWRYSATPAGVAGVEYPVRLTNLAVEGLGVTRRGVAPDHGIYASDAVAHIVSNAAPLLNFSTGTNGSVQDTGFVIPQLAFLESHTAEEALAKTNAYHLFDWGCEEHRTFYYRDPEQSSTTYRTRLSEGAVPKLEGLQGEDTHNGVFVVFTDPTGARRAAGPPGATFADYVDATLADTDSENPANAHGRRKWGKLEIRVMTTLSGALQMGQRWLADAKSIDDRGSIELPPWIRDPSGGYVPSFLLRGGDRLIVGDMDGRARRVSEMAYADDDQPKTTATFGGVPHSLEALMERVAVWTPNVVSS